MEQDVSTAHQPSTSTSTGYDTARSSRKRKSLPPVNLDWTRNPDLSNLTKYQQFIRSVDWAKTSIGPIPKWSRELRQMVLLMVAEVNPVILYWGETRAMIYNEAYVPLAGANHPTQMGMNAPDIFPQFWNRFELVLSEQEHTGQTQTGEASMLLMDRNGYLEETYFDWKLIPVIGDDGQMVGAYGRPTECTIDTVQSRRTAFIEKLAEHVKGTDTPEKLWQSVTRALSVNDRDIPLSLLYSASEIEHGYKFQLVQTLGIPKTHPCARDSVDLHEDHDGFVVAMRKAYDTHEMVSVKASDPLVDGILDDIEWRGFGIPSQEYLILPVNVAGEVAAILILGLNPRLRLDLSYRKHLQIIADILAPELIRLQLADEVQKRIEAEKFVTIQHQMSELKFAKFADRSPVGLSYTNTDGKVLFANDAWLSFTGLSRDNLDFAQWINTAVPEDIPLAKEWWHKVSVLKERGTFQIRSRQPFENGNMKSSYRTAICAVYPDLDDNGDIVNIMALVLDISEQKWIEEQLRIRKEELESSEEKYRTFAEKSPHGVIMTDENGYVQFANAAWHDFYGFERGKVTEPQPWLQGLEEEDRPKALEYFQMLPASKGPVTVEVRLKRNNRLTSRDAEQLTEFWLLSTGWAEHRADGTIDHLIFWVTDISVQKAAARILENKMEEAIRLKTQQERFIDMISHEIRNPLSAVLHCGEEIVDSMKRCISAIDGMPDPHSRRPEENAVQILMGDQINSALDAASTILYCVQHQKQIVDDVLTLSKLDSDLLVVSPVPVQPTELIRSALRIFESELKSADIELQIITDDSVSELGADWIFLDPNRFLQIVINLITNAVKFTRTSAVRRIDVKVSATLKRPPPDFEGVEFVPKRLIPRVSTKGIMEDNTNIDTKASSTDEIYLSFVVADTGKGLTESERTLLFQRFAQASPKTHAEYGGSGLGLFISRQITEMLGGEIGVGPRPSGGCIFAFYVKTRRSPPPRRASLGVESVSNYTKTLISPAPGTWQGATTPASQPAPEAAAPPPSQPSAPVSSLSRTQELEERRKVLTPEPTTNKRKVLVVEDNLVNQKVLCKQLRGRGFEVEAANHGREALEALHRQRSSPQEDTTVPKRQHFDIILCDIEMPVMNGIDCVLEIRRQETAGLLSGHVPIVGVTANVRSKQVNTAIEAGMDGVTTKPYRIDELIAHIDKVCVDTKNVSVGGS